MKLSKLFLPAMVVTVLLLIYFLYFAPSAELGLFSKFSSDSEVNQRINVVMVKSKRIGKDSKGEILSFYAKDKNNVEVKISLHEPASKEILVAEVIELLGHMHGTDFVVSRVTVIK